MGLPFEADDPRASGEERDAVHHKDANRSAAQAPTTREYQPTNRRENKSPAATASPPERSQWMSPRAKIEAEMLSPVDKSAAISTSGLTGAAPVMSEM